MSAFLFDLPASETSAGHARPTLESAPPSLSASGPTLTIESPVDNRAKDKAHIRAVRLRLLEEEQRREEEAALYMTDEERQILKQCFASVKTEFADLDGLSWLTQPPGISLGLGLGIRRPVSPDENAGMYSSPRHSSKGPPHPSPRSQSYEALALSVSRSTAATIRAPRMQRTGLSPIQMCASPTVTQNSYLATCATKRRRVSADPQSVKRQPSW